MRFVEVVVFVIVIMGVVVTVVVGMGVGIAVGVSWEANRDRDNGLVGHAAAFSFREVRQPLQNACKQGIGDGARN